VCARRPLHGSGCACGAGDAPYGAGRRLDARPAGDAGERRTSSRSTPLAGPSVAVRGNADGAHRPS
jgi:hypothetical protein